ncbi:MAG TPA: DNA-processing protein DprA [Casimicrobiaceae bacterium]|nr:DNA-processing protein DprA [Casimicrobiaceae bacterium]
MPLDSRATAWARFALVSVPQPVAVALLQRFGSAEGIFAATHAQLTQAVPPPLAARILAHPDAGVFERTRAWLDHPDHHLLAWDDDDYPHALLELGDAPPVLFYRGRRDALNTPAIAIVGSRHATPQGVDNARMFARALSQAGLAIVSGLALGIDAAAHRGALDAGAPTIACVGTGPDRIYPASNDALADEIVATGGLVSEFLPGTPPLRQNFPRRNRLISGLARGVLVVEATLQSGSLITARLAGEQGRDVFAIPGSIHSPFSKGCHKLIREGAKLVETAQDVLDELAIPGVALSIDNGVARERGATAYPAIIAALGGDPCDVDTLIARTQLSAASLSAALVELELDGHVAALPGGRWQKVA